MKLNNLIILVLLAGAASAQNEDYTKSNVAIDGYDPVAYFKYSKPVKDKKEFSYAWKGVTWNFAGSENLNEFKSNPDSFDPQ